METDKLGLNDSCRGCLSSDDLESIFECFYNEVPLAQVLMNLIPVLISENDGLSSKICELCLIKTTQAYEFQQTFLNSDKEMRAFLSNQCLDNFEVVLNSGNDLSQFNVDQIIQQTATSDERMLTATEDFVQQVDIKHEPETIQFEYGEEETPPDDEMPTEDPIPVQPPVTFKAKKNYICHLCQLPTESPSKLRRHLNTHKKDKNITNTEPQTPTFDCSDCFKQFYNEASINRHKVLHSDLMKKSKMARDADEMFLCIICSAEVPDYEQLSIHMRNHKDTSEDQVFECQLCNKGYPGIKNIIRHAKTHEENATHQCFICCKRMGMGDDLIDHMLRHEGTYKPHICKICHKAFLKNHKMVAHMKTHTNAKETYVPKVIKKAVSDFEHICEECGKSFQTKDYLKKHLARHSIMKLFSCNLCPSRFTFRSGLNAHMFVHNGLKPFPCTHENCKSAFSNAQALRKHMMIHSGIRPFTCEVCSKSFLANKDLKRHSMTHTGEKPYQCVYCTKSYAQSNDLVKHTKTHIGNNIYQCPECGECFPKYGTLKLHQNSHFQGIIEEIIVGDPQEPLIMQ